VDVVDTRANLVGVAIMLEGIQELHVTLGGFDRDDIGIEALDGGENVVEVGIAEMRVSLESVGNTGSGKLEGVYCPLEVCVPFVTAKRELKRRASADHHARRVNDSYTLTNSRLIDLNSANTSLLKINDLIAEGQGKLLGLQLTRNIRTRERPVQDGNRTSEHTLHRLLADTLCVTAPLDGDGTRTRDI
jgi:hypothetical protein